MSKRGTTALVSAAGDDKRPRTDDSTALVAGGGPGGGAVVAAGPARTSDLLAPIMLLTGHTGPVLSSKFSPDGRHVLTGSQDRTLLIWEVYGECANTMNFKGHSNAVLEVHWSADSENCFSASADKTAALWDAKTGARVRQFKGHSAVVNSFCPSRDANVCASGSDDRTVRVWDARVRTCQEVLTHPWPVTAVSVAHDGMHLYTGCLDGKVRSYDLRRPQAVAMELSGHQDIVTGLRLSPDGSSLLSNAMDNFVRCWDVKPYASGDRCLKEFAVSHPRHPDPRPQPPRVPSPRAVPKLPPRRLASLKTSLRPLRRAGCTAQLRKGPYPLLMVAQRRAGCRRLRRQVSVVWGCVGRHICSAGLSGHACFRAHVALPRLPA